MSLQWTKGLWECFNGSKFDWFKMEFVFLRKYFTFLTTPKGTINNAHLPYIWFSEVLVMHWLFFFPFPKDGRNVSLFTPNQKLSDLAVTAVVMEVFAVRSHSLFSPHHGFQTLDSPYQCWHVEREVSGGCSRMWQLRTWSYWRWAKMRWNGVWRKVRIRDTNLEAEMRVPGKSRWELRCRRTRHR